MGRIILFTGKGGVGKTSVVSAHAVKSAREGVRTLLVSADMAHNIGDIFEMRIGPQPVRISENLYGLELDPDRILREEFPDAAAAFRKLMQGSGAGAAELTEYFPLPGFENLFSLLAVAKLYRSGEYDRILVDCAPVGETLSLLKLPELLSWYMEKFFPVGKTMVRFLKPLADRRYQVELPDGRAMDDIGEMHQELLKLQDLLKDPAVSSIRLVCMPEKMIVEETKRCFMYLSLYRYQLDGVFINRVLPEQAEGAFLGGWRETQRQYLEELHRVFREVPVREIPWYPEEVRGMAAVGRIAGEILTDPDLFEVRARKENEYYTEIPGGYQLCLRLPGAEKGQVQVRRFSRDLDVSVDNYSRRIPLPDSLRGTEPAEILLEDGILKISFFVAGREAAADAAGASARSGTLDPAGERGQA